MELNDLQLDSTHKLASLFPVTELCLRTTDGSLLRAKVDTEDLPLILRFSTVWHAYFDGKLGGYYVRTRNQSLHRLVTNAPKGMVPDHIHHDTLDNRKSQLRLVTHAENIRNSRRKPNQSGIRGVYASEARYVNTPWRAQATIDGKEHFLGRFADKNVAGQVVADFYRERGIEVIPAYRTAKSKAVSA